MAEVGSKTEDSVHLAVGRALSMWENTEEAFSHLFGYFLRPRGNSFGARRAYASITTPRNRSAMLLEAATVFFRDFPSGTLERELRDLITLYGNATARRNDIAHGLAISGPQPQFAGYYLAAAMHSAKRKIDLASPYYYTDKNIDYFREQFSQLGLKAHALRESLQEHFRSPSSEKRSGIY